MCQMCDHADYADEGMPSPALNSDEKLEMVNLLIMLKDHPAFRCEYRNWRGEVATRHLVPIQFWHGATEWHPVPGLMLKAMDVEKQVERDFCVADFNLATLCAA